MGLISHETVTQLFLPNDGESLRKKVVKSLKTKGLRAFFVDEKEIFVILAETLANPFFLWYDLPWIRIPILR